jgi:hypothetical protein
VTRAGASREVVLAIAVGEPVTVGARLSVGRHDLAFGTSTPTGGTPVRLVLRVPSRNRAGRYSVKIVLRDSFGRILTLRRTIRIPAARS